MGHSRLMLLVLLMFLWLLAAAEVQPIMAAEAAEAGWSMFRHIQFLRKLILWLLVQEALAGSRPAALLL